MAKRKTYKWIENVDGTSTFRMTVDGRNVDLTRVWASYEECVKAVDLFTYFGADSAVAGKPVQSDIDAIAARKAVR